MPRLIVTSFFLTAIVLFEATGQDHPSSGQSREAFLSQLIQKLDTAKVTGDTVAIVRSLASLAINLQNAKMHNRSHAYLQEGIEYAYASNQNALISEIAGIAGYSLMTQRGNYPNTSYRTMIDSALSWFEVKCELGHLLEDSLAIAWGHRGLLTVHTRETRDRGVVQSQAGHHFQQGMKYANSERVKFVLINEYCKYLILTNQVDSAKTIFGLFEHLGYKPNNTEKLSYAQAAHDLISKAYSLDTLIALSDTILETFSKVVAATHEDKLYENDQKYEVSKTKEVLGQTEAELSSSRRLLIISIAGTVIFLALSVYLYLLFQKNKKLRDLNANLVREQNHRVKNNLQMLASMIAVQAEKAEDEAIKQNLLENEKRIQSLALLHRRLYDREYINVDVHEYFQELLEELLFSLSAQGIELKLDVDNLTLPVDTMIHLGLITNELVTNSVKHGFKGEIKDPTISLSFKQSGNEYEMVYQDNGKGFKVGSKEGFGTDLIKSQVKQLRGEYTIKNQSGFKFALRF